MLFIYVFPDNIMYLFGGKTTKGSVVDEHGRTLMAPSEAIGLKKGELLIWSCFPDLYFQHVLQRLYDGFFTVHIAGNCFASLPKEKALT